MLAPLPPSDDVELLQELASRELPPGQALRLRWSGSSSFCDASDRLVPR